MRGSGIRESNPRNARPKDQSAEALTATPPGDFAQTFAHELQSHPDLAMIVEHWPVLPEPIKAAIRVLMGTVTCRS
jgi:hypothetical protein